MRRYVPIPFLLGLVAAVVVAAPAPSAAAQASSIESRLLQLVNSVRSARLVAHSGLHSAARGHSQSMASRGGLTHAGAQSRIERATPDPRESNGAPDDGYTGAWCENTGYVSGAPTSEVAERIHEGWQRSSSHRACVADSKMTVTGIGLYFDGETWWATMESMQDTTLPGSAPAEPDPSTPRPEDPTTPRPPDPEPQDPAPVTGLLPVSTPDTEPSPTPTPSAAAVVTANPQPEATIEAISRSSGSSSSGFGQPEALAALGIAAVIALVLRRLVKAASGSGRT